MNHKHKNFFTEVVNFLPSYVAAINLHDDKLSKMTDINTRYADLGVDVQANVAALYLKMVADNQCPKLNKGHEDIERMYGKVTGVLQEEQSVEQPIEFIKEP